MTGPTPPSRPSSVPKPVQQSLFCWIGLAALVALNFLVTLAARAVTLGAVLALTLALVAAFGAREMRNGRVSGRLVAAVAGSILGALQLFGLVLVIGTLTTFGRLGFVVLILQLVAFGLIIAGLVLMFRPAANTYFR